MPCRCVTEEEAVSKAMQDDWSATRLGELAADALVLVLRK
jgi:hypothetical protein